MQRCRLIVQCLWVFNIWRCGPGCSTGPAESQATHRGNTWQGGRRHSRQPGSRKDCRFRHARGGRSTHRSNFLGRIGPNDPAAIPLAAPHTMRAPLLPACEAASGTREANNGMDVDSGFGEAPSLGHSQLVPRTTKTSPSSSNHGTPGQAALRADRPSESPTTHMRLDTPSRPVRVLTISDGSVCDLSVSSLPPS